jgi:hypothetical protein
MEFKTEYKSYQLLFQLQDKCYDYKLATDQLQTEANEVLETGIKLNGITKLLNTSTYYWL